MMARISMVFSVITLFLSCDPHVEFSQANQGAFKRFKNADQTSVRSTPRTLSWFATMTATRRGECVDYVTAARGAVAQGLLKRSLDALNAADPSLIPDSNARKSFWINAYNTIVYAALIDVVAKSPSALVSEGGFDLLRTPRFSVQGHVVAPDWIHHAILRGQFTHPSLAGMTRADLKFLKQAHDRIGTSFDPRIHFALSCGAVSCPTWAPKPYSGETLDTQLDEAAERMLASNRRGLTDNGVSALFHWYAQDFSEPGGPAAFITTYQPDAATAVDRSIDFNWRVATLRTNDPSCQPPAPESPPEADPSDGEQPQSMTEGPERECEPEATRPCGPSTAIGACTFGTSSCVDGLWGPCVGAVESTDEQCNGIDDDCDGMLDEQLAMPPMDVCPSKVGVCETAAETCSGGQWNCTLPDQYQDTEKLCDGVDNDCDGIVDEGVTPPADRPQCAGPGECSMGQDQCRDGQWECVFSGAVERQETLCDGLDNDCDGSTDEQLENCECMDGQRIPCGIDVGECTVGEQVCSAGQWSRCDGKGPQPEAESDCDGLDNDCNGTADDGLLNACQQCGTLPAEICDGVDNDCDGQTDEGVQSPCGGCGEAPDETCNQQDDDCDGFVDEGVANACGGCGDAGTELCNGVDDDCDGAIDEDVMPPADLECPNVGVCASGGPPMCRGEAGFGCGMSVLYEREEMRCDFQDNDCDGQIDEGLRNGCDFCGPDPVESCNHLDDDCDGIEDEGCPIDPNSQRIREP